MCIQFVQTLCSNTTVAFVVLISLVQGKGVYRYIGTGDGQREAVGQLRTRHCLGSHGAPSSVEITVQDTGERNGIFIGVCNKAYPTDIVPGIRATSVAIHTADEGTLLHFSCDPRPLGVTCTRGSVLRCAVSPDPQDDMGRLVEFCKDGERVGVVAVQIPEDGLYGVIGMTGSGERVLISPPVVTRSLEFDQVWEVCSPHVRHERHGLCLYVGPGYLNEESIGTVRTKQRIDPFGPLSGRSFEIRIVDSGENAYIAVGVCDRSYPHNMLPGWKETSVGYHADNGTLFDNSENGEETGQICRTGDTMRCTVQPTADGGRKQASVVFHCNGQVVGKRVTWIPEGGLYGVFGMMSKHERIQVSLPQVHEPYTIPKLSFLSVWEAVTPNLQYQENGVFVYTGQGGADMIGSVRSKLPLNPTGPNNTFEVKIVDPGNSCYIALGVCSPSFPPTQLPGWMENSVGFHADNGLILNGIGNEQLETKCNCIKGDVIRCTLEPVDDSQKQVYVVFHRNGVFLGRSMLWNSKQGFHAQVGSMSKREVIQIASPQTTPSSLPHNPTPRSMSVPAVQSSKEAVKRKQMSTRDWDYSRMTPAVREAEEPEPFSEGMHRVQTAPILTSQPQTYHRADVHTHRYTQSIKQGPPHDHHQHPKKDLPQQFLPPSSHLHGADATQQSHTQLLHHQEHIEDRSDDPPYYHQPHTHTHPSPSPEPPPTQRSVPHAHLAPFEHAMTASPLPLQPVGEHPLAEQGTKGSGAQSELTNPREVAHNVFYASQVSTASAASDSDLHYQSQLSSRITAGGRQRAASGAYEQRTPHDVPRRFQAQTQPVPQRTTQFATPPGGASPMKPPFSGLEKSFRGGAGSTERIFKPGFDDSDSPPRHTTVKGSKHEVCVFESRNEPTKEVEVCSVPEPRLYTKKENSFCRILHNASCSEDGTTLHCTLPEDSSEPCFVMRRLQLTEKMPYFEVELVEQKPSEKVVIGIVPPDHLYTIRMGSVPCTIAYHMATGLLVAGKEEKSVTKPCTAGDVVGCRVDWSYKLEAYNCKNDCLVGVEWFVNGCSVAKNTISAPSSGLYPTIKMKSGGTVVIFRHRIGLKPDSYFTSRPHPEGFKNIDVPLKTSDTWKCILNAEIDENCYITPKDLDKASLPSIVQSHTPLTTVQPYFEVELQHPMESYSIFSVGAIEGESSDSDKCIPGEVANSIALFPLLGLVMCDGRISTTLPLAIEEEMKTLSEKLTIGVGVDFHQNVPHHSLTAAKRVAVFFTVNYQLINSTYMTIPSTGLFPTVAVGSDSSGRLLKLKFSDPWPRAPALPLGFARAPQKAFEVSRLNSVVSEKTLPKGTDSPQVLQAALPLSRSHTYFEMKLLECHESHIFSCGLAPHNFPLTSHPGDLRDSIGFFSSYGSVHHGGKNVVVSSPFNYRGARMGCGARFPDDGSSRYMEVFFTLNRSMVARTIVENREPGLFPTVGFYTKGSGVVSIDLYAEDPFPNLQFSTTWRDLGNITSEGAFLHPTSSSETCVAQLLHSVPLYRPAYFTIRMTARTNSARILIGFTNSSACPLLDDSQIAPSEGKSVTTKKSMPVAVQEGWTGCVVDMTGKQVLVEDSLYGVQLCHLQQSDVYGCGIEPIEGRKSHLFFFTCNKQVLFAKSIHLKRDMLFPTIFVKGSIGRISVDACAVWPLQSAIGRGWARVNHLFLENSQIKHVAARGTSSRMPVGFAQASMPITPSSSYFEAEVCSRSIEKAIAVGLAPRSYPGNTWVGWKHISVAYHLDDGCLFTGDGLKGHKIGPQIFKGQVVGCGITTKPGVSSEKEKDAKVEVFFTVNRVLIVEQKISVPYGGFYPTICLESPTESVVFHRYPCFPPIRHLVGPEWANCYSVHQAGMLLEHSYQGEMPVKGISRGFCQASRPFSPTRPYFEIKIVRSSSASSIQVGVAVRLPVGCRSPNTDSVMYYTNGQLLLRSGGNKSTQLTEKSGIGDVVGCGVTYTGDDEPSAVEFYLNKMKVATLALQEKWRKGPLFPTIVLSHPGNAVLPQFNLSPPEWDRSSLIGWLRTERVQVKGNIASYLPSSTAKNMEVGLCQLSQCLERELNSSFEVEVLDRGERCCIAVGAAGTNYPAVNQPGWKENSVAYHGDDGNLFNNNPYGVSFGPPWKERDVIGVGVRQPAYDNPHVVETQVYFVKNGVELGHTTVIVPPSGLFPTIGFHSSGEKVKITLNSGSHTLGNFNKALLKWRDVYGMKLQSTSQENTFLLQYLENGRRMPFTGIKPAVAAYGEPFSEKLQYFELDLLSVETNSAVAIGVVPRDYSLELAPGWGKDSLGYHSDNGQLYQARDRGKYFGPIAKKGDAIGCGISFTPNNQNQCSIFFTYNGVEIGRVRTSLPVGGFYPCICLMQRHDRVLVRLSETFKPKWSTPERHMVGLMRISNCSYCDQIVQFSGTQNSTAPGFAQFALPMHKDHNYFAAHVLKAEDTVVIGLAVRDYPIKYLPGSMSVSMAYDITKGSIRAVYDSDNFHRFDDSSFVCSVGDRVGCGVVSSDSKSRPGFVYFTRNGVVVKRIGLTDLFEDLYPVVGFSAEKRSSLLFMDWKRPLFDSPNLLCDC
jgi:hypothetical protein